MLLGKWGEQARAADWVRDDELAYMAEQPYRLTTTLPGGKSLVMVHGSPWEPYNEYIYPNSAALARFREIDADYVVLGHTHYQMAERVGRALVINPGSAGEARDARNHFRLSYAVLDTETRRSHLRRLPRPDARRRRPVDHPRRRRPASGAPAAKRRTRTATSGRRDRIRAGAHTDP